MDYPTDEIKALTLEVWPKLKESWKWRLGDWGINKFDSIPRIVIGVGQGNPSFFIGFESTTSGDIGEWDERFCTPAFWHEEAEAWSIGRLIKLSGDQSSIRLEFFNEACQALLWWPVEITFPESIVDSEGGTEGEIVPVLALLTLLKEILND